MKAGAGSRLMLEQAGELKEGSRCWRRAGSPLTPIQREGRPGSCRRLTSTCWPLWPSPMWSRGTCPLARKEADLGGRRANREEERGMEARVTLTEKVVEGAEEMEGVGRQYFSCSISDSSRFQSRMSGLTRSSLEWM